MKIIIVGAGKIGLTVAASLSDEGHSITVIDRSREAVDRAVASCDVMGLVGNGAICDTQLEAGADGAELLIATTSSDELNILCCLVARRIGVGYTIARVRNPEYSAQSSMFTDDLGVSMTVNPEYDAATEISQILRFPAANHVDMFARGRVELAELKIPDDSELVGKRLSEIHGNNVLICAVRRGDEVFIPDGSFKLEAEDVIHVSGKRGDISEFTKLIGRYQNRIRVVMIVGGGKICFYLARQLAEWGIRTKIIEKDPARCNELSAVLDSKYTEVVLGDGTVQAVLNEQGVSNRDAFVALTGIDEENIIISMYARASGSGKVITKINRLQSELLSTFGLDSVISPKTIAATRIIAFARAIQSSGDGALTLYRLMDGKVEALEFKADEHNKCIFKCFKDMRLKSDLLVAAIIRKNKVIYPCGSDVIQPSDQVVVVTSHHDIYTLDDILKD